MSIITSKIISSYSQCPRKAYLFLFQKELENIVKYIEVLEKRKESYKEVYLSQIAPISSEIILSNPPPVNLEEKFVPRVILRINQFQAECDLLYLKADPKGRLESLCYEPRIFATTYSVTKEEKIRLFYIFYLLQKILKAEVKQGKIITLDGRSHLLVFYHFDRGAGSKI